MQASDFQEGDVFLDINFFYNFLRPSSGYKHQIKTFFEMLIFYHVMRCIYQS